MSVQPAAGGELRDRGAAGALWACAWPPLRALAWGAIGFGIPALAISLGRGSTSLDLVGIAVGYPFGLIGWLLGVGGWESVLRPFAGGAAGWDEGRGLARYFRLSTDHKVIGLQVTFFTAAIFMLAGLAAMNMRAELATPRIDWFPDKQTYNEVLSVHGTLMMFSVATVALFSGLGHYLVPLMVGARRMAFPRLEGVGFWLFPAGALMILLSLAVGGYETGWTGYEPLASQGGIGQMFYALGSATLILGSSLTGVNIIATVIFLRAPGLTWRRLPILVWAQLATAFLNWLWFALILTAMTLQVTDLLTATNFFGGPATAAAEPGKPLIWQDLFWLFGHPEVYIIMIPAWGLWLELIPVYARKTLFAYRWAVAGILGVALLSGYVWTHHMFAATEQSRLIPFMASTELISAPTSLILLAAVGTLWRGRIHLRAPLVLVVMSMLNFVVGGISGTFLADVPADFMEQDTYFVVAHFHYTILGGMVFAWLAAMYHYLPKFTGRMYNERWAQGASVATFVFFNWTFFSMFLVALNGMNRRVATYPGYLETQNLWISIPAWLLGLSFFVHLAVFVRGWFAGRPASSRNPWRARTLEWAAASPPPPDNFERQPLVVADFYAYGEAGDEPALLPIPGIREEPPPDPERVPAGAGEQR